MQRVSWVLVLVVVCLLRASGAHAGPVEQLTQLTFQPDAPDVAVLRYINGGDGLFYSRDGAKTFALACTSMIDPALVRGGSVTVTGDGKTLMGLFDGMFQDDGTGCTWSRVDQFQGKWISDFAHHPSDPNITYAVSSNGNAGSMNGIFERDQDGNWSELGARDEVLIGRLHVVDVAGKLRFYESAVRGMNTDDAGMVSPNYVIRVSDDDGATWEEHVFADAGNATLRLQVVDPKNPDRIVVTVDRDPDEDSVYVSDDKGATFTEYLKVTQIGGVAMAPDGRIWLGDNGSSTMPMAESGLWSAASLDDAPKKIGDYVVQCLTWEPKNETLFVCQHWWMGTADPESGAFTELFRLTEAKDFLDCEGKDVPMACKMQLCGAYCGPGHFAQAPLCAVYSDPLCGPAVAPDASGTGGTSGGGTGGTSAGSGGAGSGGRGTDMMMGGAGGSGGGSGEVLDAGAAGGGGSGKKKSGGGCSALDMRAGAVPNLAVWLAILGVVRALALRRRGA